MRTRIEILKGTEWKEIYLGDEKMLKYNIVVNRVGSMSSREISHSNTFSLPYVSQNIEVLGINPFNPSNMAKSFNLKYKAKYYIKEKLEQIGYLVINNTNNGTINVNFIDEALNIIDKWGSTTYKDLLTSGLLSIPSDYASAIADIRNYNMSKTSVLVPVSSISTRGNKLCLFPNNLNAIGDKFQIITSTGVRDLSGFNPYQSRPIWNMRALMDLAVESYGYTPIYDNTIDWGRLKSTYMVESKLDSSSNPSNPYTISKHSVKSQESLYYQEEYYISGPFQTNQLWFRTKTFFTYNSDFLTYSLNDLAPHIPIMYKTESYNLRSILPLSQSNLSTGKVVWKYNSYRSFTSTDQVIVDAIWRYPDSTILVNGYSLTENYTDVGTPLWNVMVEMDKSTITNPGGGAVLLGLLFKRDKDKVSSPLYGDMYDLQATEEFLDSSVLSYDTAEQIESELVDLTFSAPKLTIKELLSAIMQREGILISFDNRLKTVRFFTYTSYKVARDSGDYVDWSEYFEYFSEPYFNTDYGNDYAKLNEIGLKKPFAGNTAKISLSNQGADSRYKDFVQNFSDKFSDIESVVEVATVPPHFEYTNKGFGLIEDSGDYLEDLVQYRANGSTQGVIPSLTKVYNVNGSSVPYGLLEWYNLVDTALKCTGRFKLPAQEIRNLKIHEPIYVARLGGFYIIEEIEEYTDAQTPVNIKLIKLL